MSLIIQYFWEINNLFNLVGNGIAINEIWKYTTLDFQLILLWYDQNQVNQKVQQLNLDLSLEFRYKHSTLVIF